MIFKEKDYNMPDQKKIYRIWRKQLVGHRRDGNMDKFWWIIEKFHLDGMLYINITIL